MSVTLCPSDAPDASHPLYACSERLRDEEDKITESVAAEPFSPLADPPLTAQDNRPRPARSALVRSQIGDEMDSEARRCLTKLDHYAARAVRFGATAENVMSTAASAVERGASGLADDIRDDLGEWTRRHTCSA
jgi:hypothetical protein